jgi:hypothetical protein
MKKLVIVLGMCLAAGSMFAQDQKKPDAAAQAAAMEAFMKAIMPGASHKMLDPMVGTWDATLSMWESADAAAMTSSGVSENKWILGGRYLEQRFNGSFMGMPFEGIGYTGFDNVTHQFWGTWMDNMSTGVMLSSGTSSDGKNWRLTTKMSDPMTGQVSSGDETLVIESPDRHVMEMWGAGPDGKKFKMMRIVYTRKK